FADIGPKAGAFDRLGGVVAKPADFEHCRRAVAGQFSHGVVDGGALLCLAYCCSHRGQQLGKTREPEARLADILDIGAVIGSAGEMRMHVDHAWRQKSVGKFQYLIEVSFDLRPDMGYAVAFDYDTAISQQPVLALLESDDHVGA